MLESRSEDRVWYGWETLCCHDLLPAPACLWAEAVQLEFADSCVTVVWGVGAQGTSGRWESCTLLPAFGQHGVTGMHQDECLLGFITPALSR